MATSKKVAAAKAAAKAVAAKKAAKKAPAKKTAPAKKRAAKKAPAKERAAKKASAKKTAAKKVAAKAKTAKATNAAVATAVAAPEGLAVLVFRLITAAAERGLSVVYGALGDAALAAVVPLFGEAGPPASYRRFMASFGSLRVLDDDGEVEGLCVYTPAEVARATADVVRVPAGVTWEDEQGRACTISTDHLVAFAAGPSGCVWCFDASAPGELPVVCHDQDEPLHARAAGTGAPVSSRAPDYADFMAWLAGQVEALCAPPRRRRH